MSMQTIRITILPLDILWDYREFNRDEVPAPRIPFVHSYTVEEITQYVRVHGIEPVELSVIKDRALLTDGNHRMIAARKLGVDHVPVKITVLFGDGSEAFYGHTLERFKPISPALELELKKLFLGEGMLDSDVWPGIPSPTKRKRKKK
jgi:hypothetical protein